MSVSIGMSSLLGGSLAMVGRARVTAPHPRGVTAPCRDTLGTVSADEGYFGARVAARYDAASGGMFDPAVVQPAVERLAELAGTGRALEFAIGTGRIALPLAERGVPVVGIDNSEAMLARLREKPGAERVEALIGDMATTRVDGEFSLVYLVFNTIFNLTTQDGQVACFENAAAHLAGGGRFVIEARVPELQRLPLGQTVLPWRADPGGLSFYVYDIVTQRLGGQHYYLHDDGRMEASPTEMRYAWHTELDLMARIAGLTLEHRWGGWKREPFTGLSPSHVSVYVKP
jgi:SAM-dependent methyltransferase